MSFLGKNKARWFPVLFLCGHIINTIRYVDDKAVVANSQKGLQQLRIT